MHPNFRTASIIAGVMLLIPLLASAQSADPLQTLLSQITQLQQQLSQLQSSTASGTTDSGSASCPSISHTLSLGSQGPDVVTLQQFLVTQGLLGADSVTGYFGPKTQAAVQQWQAKEGLVSSGDAATTGWGVVGNRVTKIAQI